MWTVSVSLSLLYNRTGCVTLKRSELLVPTHHARVRAQSELFQCVMALYTTYNHPSCPRNPHVNVNRSMLWIHVLFSMGLRGASAGACSGCRRVCECRSVGDWAGRQTGFSMASGRDRRAPFTGNDTTTHQPFSPSEFHTLWKGKRVCFSTHFAFFLTVTLADFCVVLLFSVFI